MNGGEVRTVTVPAEAEQDAPVIGDAILIETRVSRYPMADVPLRPR